MPASDQVNNGALRKKLSRTEWNLLTRFLSANERFGNFWFCVKRMQDPQGKSGTRAYALAVDVQFLKAYAPEWRNLQLDEAVLLASCPEWPQIRERLQKFLKQDKEDVPFGIFMLWPRLCDDLSRWQDLSNEQRLGVTNAVFALSSISWSQWFIETAIAQLPELAGELAYLGREEGHEGKDPTEAASSEDEELSHEVSPLTPSSDAEKLETGWIALGEQLRALARDWPKEPTKDILHSVASLGTNASLLAELVPDERSSAGSQFQAALQALHEGLINHVQGGTNLWLSAEDIDAINARWQIARSKALDDAAILMLTEDAEQALERIAIALTDVQKAQAQLQEARKAADQLEQDLSGQVSARLRIDKTNRQLLAQEEAISAKRRVAELMLLVMSSASPWGEDFDPNADYVAESGQQCAEDAHYPVGVATHNVSTRSTGPTLEPADEKDSSSSAESELLGAQHHDETVQEAKQPGAKQPDNFVSSETFPLDADPPLNAQAERNSVVPLSSHPNVEGVLPAPATVSPQQIATAGDQSKFTDGAGELCSPIWTLLRNGRPALAYQFAEALTKTRGDLLVPHPPLLRSVALASGLTTSDGALAMSIGEALGEVRPEWFDPKDAPSNWHAAINLLLLAATLKPMVLAPASNAAAVARYRHLDGRHAGLLELVRKVSDLSESLTAFNIGPTVLQSVADGASQKTQLSKLSKQAEDWLIERAPSKKFRYAPASQVWLHWLKPGEAIHKLMDPIARGSVQERSAVRMTIGELADYHIFVGRVKETDRRQLQRRGQDIHSGALEHLWAATREAVALAKEWLGTASIQSQPGGRLPEYLEQLKSAFATHADQACSELDQVWDDEWGQVQAASQVLREEVRAVAGMFKEGDAAPLAEPSPVELLAQELLWVPDISLGSGWDIKSNSTEIMTALRIWSASPLSVDSALQERLKAGDFAGAELLLQAATSSGDEKQHIAIEKAREAWVKDLQRFIQEARRASEVGLAYGYLSDAERSDFESDVSAVEAGVRETDRFDESVARLKLVKKRIEEQKATRVEEARRELEKESFGLSPEVIAQLTAPLGKSDIHTFNELLQRVRQGVEPWPDKETRRDVFSEFFPEVQAEIFTQLGSIDAANVDKLIRSGGQVGRLSFDLDGDQQARAVAEECYRAWATSLTRKAMSREALRKILDSLGFQARSLDQDRSGQGWMLHTAPIDDREICVVPHFGSRAQGRYRVLVFHERLTPEDLLRRVGDSTQQTATVVLYLARPQARFWSDLGRLSKEKQRSFLLLDESILLFLLAQSGSRLTTWFGIALPFTYSEPYDASAGFVPSEMFYGRASELESVKAQGGCYFIYGGRQLGKTALLRRAERTFNDAATDHYAVWIDLLAQGIGERRPASDIWVSLADKLRELKIPGLELPVVNPAKPASVDSLLTALKAFLEVRPGRRILVLLDEADRFFEQDGRQGAGYAETRRLKQLMDETERRFKVVFAGLHNVLRTATTSNQPLGHLNEAVRIGPLMDEREIRAAEELITRPVEAAGFVFEDRSLVMRVLAQTNYYPSLIQLYCTQLLRHARESKLRQNGALGPRFKIEESDIESVFSGRPLRDAIRSKFRLTLQLDDRYEVIANAIGLEALAPRFDHAQGIEWRKVREDCTTWWPEGFATTSERDFLVLLEEMVQLGVLSEVKPAERFSLRNPNVLLLLGSKQEIENTLQAEREPRVEFESTIFRPALSGRVDNPARNPLTYRQLDEIVQARSSVLLVAASEASGGAYLLTGLRDQPGSADGQLFVLLDKVADKKGFVQELDRQFKKRVSEGVTVMLVPAEIPWTVDWVAAARAKVSALKSVTSFVSVVFHADAPRLWALTGAASSEWPQEPWLSVLPWARGFVRKWLEELQLPVDSVDRLREMTGYWGGLLESVAQRHSGALDFAHNLDRISKLLDDSQWRRENVQRLTGGIHQAQEVLAAMHSLGDGVTEDDLVEFGELPRELVQRTLRWAGPLGLLVAESGSAWSINPFLKKILEEQPA